MDGCLSLKGITKRFGDFTAVDGIDLEVRSGEVLALLGENGAGKSTLMNILYGLYRPSAGQILLDGEPVSFSSPLDAIGRGIGMVHQHFMLIPAFTVAENVAIGQGCKRISLPLEKLAQELLSLAGRYQLQVKPFAKVADLPVGLQQQVEILKALHQGARILILDEPTGVLTPQEIAGLMRTIRHLADQGTTVIFISHKLNEVLEISDRIVVLRQGKIAGERRTRGATTQDLARMMVGRDVSFQAMRLPQTKGSPVLVLEGVCAADNRGLPALHEICMTIEEGTIVGIAGVDGNGQSELAEVITGLRPVNSGTIRVDGRDLTRGGPADYIASKVGHVPEDRKKTGSIQGFTLWETAVMKNHADKPFCRKGVLRRQAMLKHTQKLADQYDVRRQDLNQTAHSLSGGNLQKLILAREITATPRLLVIVHPTRGLDVGAIEFVHSQLLQARSQGAAILLISSELEEVMALSDRLLVLYEGSIVKEFLPQEYDRSKIGFCMAGGREVV